MQYACTLEGVHWAWRRSSSWAGTGILWGWDCIDIGNIGICNNTIQCTYSSSWHTLKKLQALKGLGLVVVQVWWNIVIQHNDPSIQSMHDQFSAMNGQCLQIAWRKPSTIFSFTFNHIHPCSLTSFHTHFFGTSQYHIWYPWSVCFSKI